MNAAGFPILSLVTYLPLVGVVILLFIRGDRDTVAANSRWAALWTSLIVFALSLVLWVEFDRSDPGFQFVEFLPWMPEFGMNYQMGVDGISILFVLLTTVLTPICVIASWEVIKNQVREYMITFLVLETMMVGTFCSLNFIMFYIFFEGTLIPMFLIIGIWGGERRIYSAYKFFLYTLAGSVLFLLAILAIWFQTGTMDIVTLLHTKLPVSMQIWLFLGFMASFGVKLPMWPVHTWLPDAHVEAPTAGSVLLAGVLLKLGAYGFLRFSFEMLPFASQRLEPLMFALGVMAVIYTSFVALGQTDFKKLVAYSSVAHMGLVTIGIFSFNVQGVQGALFQMISHGVVSAALFLCVGVLYDRLHTHEIARFGGLIERMPLYALILMFFSLASVGLPGTSGFVGEILVMIGALQVNFWVALLGGTGMILSIAYMLYLYRRIIYGVVVHADLKGMLDISPREVVVFAPLVILVLWMGVFPTSFTSFWAATVSQMVHNHTAMLHGIHVAGLVSR